MPAQPVDVFRDCPLGDALPRNFQRRLAAGKGSGALCETSQASSTLIGPARKVSFNISVHTPDIAKTVSSTNLTASFLRNSLDELMRAFAIQRKFHSESTSRVTTASAVYRPPMARYIYRSASVSLLFWRRRQPVSSQKRASVKDFSTVCGYQLSERSEGDFSQHSSVSGKHLRGEHKRRSSANLVYGVLEAGGIEPPSEGLPPKMTTCLADVLISLFEPPTAGSLGASRF
jgi:hypothetical protein